MGIARRDTSGALRQIAVLKMRDAGSVLRTIKLRTRRDADNVLRVVYSALAAITDTNSVTGLGSSTSSIAVTTGSVTASPVNGIGPFTYAWTQVGGATWTINSPTAATTTFTSPAAPPYVVRNAQFICTITDASGASAPTPAVSAQVNNIGGGGIIP